MNARITPRGAPHRTELYGGVLRIVSDGLSLWLSTRYGLHRLTLRLVAEIALDDDPGDWWD